MNMRLLALAGVAAGALVATSANAFPAIGNDTNGPTIMITFTQGGPTISQVSNQGPYDGVEDTYIGVQNTSGSVVNSIDLSSSQFQIFGFDGDGICGYQGVDCSGNQNDNTGYGGPISFFTNISQDLMSGTVNFQGGLADGGSTFFALEDPINASQITTPGQIGGVPEPATWAMMLLGFFGLGAMARSSRRRAALATA